MAGGKKLAFVVGRFLELRLRLLKTWKGLSEVRAEPLFRNSNPFCE